MNRRLFLKRPPTYQEDPSFYAERVAGTLPNVYKQTFTENGNYTGTGNYTGYDITVNVSGGQSQFVIDRMRSNQDDDVYLLKDFLNGTGDFITCQLNDTIVIISQDAQDAPELYDIYVENFESEQQQVFLRLGAKYCIIKFQTPYVRFGDVNGDLFWLPPLGYTVNQQSNMKFKLTCFNDE